MSFVGFTGGEQKKGAPGSAIQRLSGIALAAGRKTFVELADAIVPGDSQKRAANPVGRVGPARIAGNLAESAEKKPGADVVLGAETQRGPIHILFHHLVLFRPITQADAPKAL